jgi:peptide deformylase
MESKIMPIVGYGSPILREVCLEAENKPETLVLVKSLIETMNSIGTAVGLAAPQINSNLRMFTMNVYGTLSVVINPVIKKSRGSKQSDEGCLSIPGLNGLVPERNEIIDVEYYDENFNKKRMKLNGFAAIVFQHEFDHLNGILYTDRMTREGQEAVNDKLSDIAKGIHTSPYEMVFTHLLKDPS